MVAIERELMSVNLKINILTSHVAATNEAKLLGNMLVGSKSHTFAPPALAIATPTAVKVEPLEPRHKHKSASCAP